jgi:hypothetical protein
VPERSIKKRRNINGILTLPVSRGIALLDSVLSLLRQFFRNCFLDILKGGFAAEQSVVHSYVRRFDSLSFVTEPQETGIDGLYFNIIRIFFFDSPGQSAEIGSPFPGRTI